ncbi:hypothetical protein BDP81DRAFT_13846 [Colletotrichum phormii]|uniref:Uncharacterized protein n=1 Tax=Colletotrichum phormii TaxID=359342 RepID=A0AAJ0A3W7_9PEZI|nr:uncharacterized protein BDP81DRAFT_13846 [Colletotrichum phormii]KAK1656001.1 hypothetical protein BDP81DRAFT_13846 [Colletotrichum phormii]
MSNALDYLFQGYDTGVFYRILTSYSVAGHAIIILGLTADEWANTHHKCKPYQSWMFWFWTSLIHSTYVFSIYPFAGVVKTADKGEIDWSRFVPTIIGIISGVLYAVYGSWCVTCSVLSWKYRYSRRSS